MEFTGAAGGAMDIAANGTSPIAMSVLTGTERLVADEMSRLMASIGVGTRTSTPRLGARRRGIERPFDEAAPFSWTALFPRCTRTSRRGATRTSGTATPPQAQALPLASQARHTLICSPTGTGKTLAAFLPVISRLAELRDADELLARTYCLYVSPLRALGYDVEHNLRRPLREMGILERPDTERARKRRAAACARRSCAPACAPATRRWRSAG